MQNSDINKSIENLNLSQLQQKNKQLEWELANKEAHIEQLLEEERRLNRELDSLKNGRAYRMFSVVVGIGKKILPFGSRRRFGAKYIIQLLKHPIRTIKKGGFNKQYQEYRCMINDLLGTPALNPAVIEKQVIAANMKAAIFPTSEAKNMSDYEIIEVPYAEKPKVSIIIPVYNQFNYTYHSIKSIIENSGNVTYEIIVANDCSTDLTNNIDRIIHGVNLITNKTNLRFLKNCNNAAKYAKGEYILFLNNDTLVMPNWLEPLIDTFDKHKNVGLVGSKLVYPDGTLQEAGGIVWRDGSAWNYGNGQNPDMPEYNYVKEVDYISGAAIMISKVLWDEIGGFDEYFVPAYCEDSDLAFTVRSKGYKVLYQPESVVIHFEGVSNGTDVNTGQKAYQIDNQRKFVHKWRDELRKHSANALDPFHARDYSWDKPTLLMIDHYVPQFDKDAGSRTVFQYLKLFIDKGYNVKFIGDNFYKHEPYTTILQQMGVEVLYGPEYANGWEKWITGNAPYIDYVFLNRPHISVKYIDYIKEHTSAKIIYYGHDLHFLRESREYELTHRQELLQSIEKWKVKELTLMNAADIAYYPSYVEEEAIKEIDPNVNVKAIPAYLFDDVKVDGHNYDYNLRKDMMFIGGFGHTPNIDAVKWIANDILPRLLKRLPDLKIYILGSNMPDEISELANEHLIMKGFVTDEELEEMYSKCRMSIVPLRYGAGIKGKVVEAMKYGTPVVTTMIGAEGIVDASDVMIVEDNVEELTGKIVEAYTNSELLTDLSRKSLEYIDEHFTPNCAWNVVGEDFT